jgi:hypothetical protein
LPTCSHRCAKTYALTREEMKRKCISGKRRCARWNKTVGWVIITSAQNLVQFGFLPIPSKRTCFLLLWNLFSFASRIGNQ